jgi:hypothetical protein
MGCKYEVLNSAFQNMYQPSTIPIDISTVRRQSLLHAIYHFKIAEAVPIQGDIGCADLAKRVNTDAVTCAV